MKKADTSFLSFFESRIEYLKACRRFGTAANYRRAKSSLERYLRGQDLPLRNIDGKFVDNYTDWLMKKGMVRNSASFHMRILRAVYNKAVRKGLVKQTYPFSETYTGIDKTGKRCVDKDVISSLLRLDFSDDGDLSLARDLFLFSVYTRGMSFVDMVYLRKKDVSKGEIIYRRKKTKGILRIKVELEIKELLNRYDALSPDSEYVFPILKDVPSEECYQRYQNALSCYNYRLKQISDKLGLQKPLTSYVSRHTWASLAYKMEIPVSVISTGMGHSSESVTRIYLDSLDNSVVDSANSRLLRLFHVSK